MTLEMHAHRRELAGAERWRSRTGSGVATVGGDASAKWTLMAVDVLPADTAATMSLGSACHLGASWPAWQRSSLAWLLRRGVTATRKRSEQR